MEKFYIQLKSFIRWSVAGIIPYLRRILRFLALPYYYFYQVNWEECTASRIQVAKDLLYIFFILKYYPDNYSMCRLWERDRSEWIYYYGSIYDPYQRGRLRKKVQKKEYEIIFQNKDICYKLCQASNFPLPKQYGVLEPSRDYRNLIKLVFENNDLKRMMIKPLCGKGGKGIVLAYSEILTSSGKRHIFVNKGAKTISLDDFLLTETSVAQEFIVQHPSLTAISPSVNTIRIVTLLTINGHVMIIGALMRFGVNNAYIDNTSSGGVAVGIDLDTGSLKNHGYDSKGKKYSFHPTSQFSFKGFIIPFWDEVQSLAEKIQTEFSFYKLLGSDIAITDNGPVVIEINGAHDNVGLEQKCGPILLDPSVRNEFKRYNLLINKLAKL